MRKSLVSLAEKIPAPEERGSGFLSWFKPPKGVDRWIAFQLLLLWVVAAPAPSVAADTNVRSFRVATFNLENYLQAPAGDRPQKSPAAKTAVREAIRQMDADVLALQEVGGSNSLFELRFSLRAQGQNYPFFELLRGLDTNINLAVLSKFPITASRLQTNASFLLHGRRFYVRRGFLEVDVQVNPGYSFTLIAAHLKSKRPVPEADQLELRVEESLLLRRRIDDHLKRNPKRNLVVVGDLNDTQDSRPTRIVLGKGQTALIDTRPSEQHALFGERPAIGRREITWTYFYAKEDSYSRLDYILISRAMAREWDHTGSYILSLPNWGEASDHRPITARFRATDD